MKLKSKVPSFYRDNSLIVVRELKKNENWNNTALE